MQIQMNEVPLQVHSSPILILCFFSFVPHCYKFSRSLNVVPLYSREQQGRLAVKHDRTP